MTVGVMADHTSKRMKSVNLIPAPRLAARQRRLHLRRCAAVCCAWAVGAATVAGASHALWRQTDDPQADQRLSAVNDEIERTERAIAGAKIHLAAAQSTLRANEAIASQPDWSILLAVLAREVGDDVVLRSCRVHPVGVNAGSRAEARRTPAIPATSTPPAAAPTPPPAGEEPVTFVLESSGIARTLPSAHRFVRDLERTGLFARVTLLDSTRESFLSENAVAFRIECSLDEPAGAGAAKAGDGAQAAIDKR